MDDANRVIVILSGFDDKNRAPLTAARQYRKFINAPIGGGGNSPATIFCKYSRPDRPLPASARARGSSQVIVRVRFSFWSSLMVVGCEDSHSFTEDGFALLHESRDAFDEIG